MATISISQAINKMKLGNADKLALSAIVVGLTNDLETLRAKNAALAAKLDTAGATVAGLGTNYVATTTVAAGALSVGK